MSTPTLSRQALIASLDTMQKNGDPEALHATADDLLIQFLRNIGYGDVADAYEQAQDRVGFWYA
jgi:hypothetical protein